MYRRHQFVSLAAALALTAAACGGGWLDRHPAVVLEVLSEVDGGHAALAEFPLDPIASSQRGSQSVVGVGHRLVEWGGDPQSYGLREGGASRCGR